MDTLLRRRSLPRLPWFAPRSLVVELATAVLDWQERLRQRADLRGLDDRMLADLGLSRADIERECGKSFWQG